MLTDAHKRRRLSWAHAHRDWTAEQWSRVIWSDETKVMIQDNCPQYVRLVDGHSMTDEHYLKTFKHPLSVMVWACFSARGTGRMHIIEGNLNTEAYLRDIVDRRVQQQLADWFPGGDGIFQQDNAPAHVSVRAKEHFAKLGITLLDWPPSSPDLNPIENLWSIIKRRLRIMNVNSKQQLIDNFIHVWNRDEEISQICANLVNSMPNRIRDCITAKGGQTRY